MTVECIGSRQLCCPLWTILNNAAALLKLEFLGQLDAENRGVNRIRVDLTHLRPLDPAVIEPDRRVVLGDMRDRRVFLDPGRDLVPLLLHLVEILQAERVRPVGIVRRRPRVR